MKTPKRDKAKEQSKHAMQSAGFLFLSDDVVEHSQGQSMIINLDDGSDETGILDGITNELRESISLYVSIRWDEQNNYISPEWR